MRAVPPSGAPREDRPRRSTCSPAAGWTSGSAPAGCRRSSTRSGSGSATVGERFDALEDSLDGAVGARSGDPVTYDGPTVTLARRRCLAPAPERPPAVWVGGKGGPRLLRLAARHADGWNMVWRVAPEGYVGKVSAVRAACDAAGRDPATFGSPSVCTRWSGEDEATAQRGVRAWPRRRAGGCDGRRRYESWRADTFSGTPDQVIERVAGSRRSASRADRVALGPAVRGRRSGAGGAASPNA